MGIFNSKATTPALVEAREKLAGGGALIVLAEGAFSETTTNLEQVKGVFRQMSQDEYVVVTTSETPEDSQPVLEMLETFGVDHVKELDETDLKNVSLSKLMEHARFYNLHDSGATLNTLKDFILFLKEDYLVSSLEATLKRYLKEKCTDLFEKIKPLIDSLKNDAAFIQSSCLKFEKNNFENARRLINWVQQAQGIIAEREEISELLSFLSPVYNPENRLPKTLDELIDKLLAHYKTHLESKFVINIQGIKIKFSAKDFNTIRALQKILNGEFKEFLALLSTLSRLQCKIPLLSKYISFPEEYSLINVKNIIFVGQKFGVVQFFKGQKVRTVFTGSIPCLSSTPPAQKFAQALGLDFQAVLSSIIEENRRIFGLVLECGFNPLIEFIKEYEKEYKIRRFLATLPPLRNLLSSRQAYLSGLNSHDLHRTLDT